MEGLAELMEMFPGRPVEEIRATLKVSTGLDDAIDRLVSVDDLRATLDNSFNLNGYPNGPPGNSSTMGRNVIDMTSSSPSSSPPQQQSVQVQISNGISEDEFLANVLAMFPDVNHEHVRRLYKEQKLQSVDDIMGAVVEKLLDAGSSYPRQEKASSKKRKRSLSAESIESDPYLANDRKDVDNSYIDQAIQALKQEFSRVPDTYIRSALAKNRSFLAPTYIAIAKAEAAYDEKRTNEFKRLRSLRYQDKRRKPQFSKEIMDELEFAKTKVRELKRQKQEEDDAKFAASLDHKEQEDSGQLMECQCCFGDEQFSNMTQCREGHLFCLDCAKNYAESQVGQGKYQLNCMDGSGCKAEFPRTEIMRFVSDKVLLALDKLQQEAELRLAAMDDLEKCPFCEYAAILGPIEEDKEFRCENSECGEVSCRLCKEKTHIPKTCEEYKKEDKHLNARHAVEEAMTAAMVRTCNKCQNKFIKESGCNKMTCTRCGALQCYVCSETVRDYTHFQGQGVPPNGKCPLYDNHEARHEEERTRAAQAVIAELAQKDPTITAEDVEIKLSEEAKRAETDRHRRVAGIHQAAGAQFDFGANAQNIFFPQLPNGANVGGQFQYNPAAMQPPPNQLFPGMPQAHMNAPRAGLGAMPNVFGAFVGNPLQQQQQQQQAQARHQQQAHALQIRQQQQQQQAQARQQQAQARRDQLQQQAQARQQLQQQQALQQNMQNAQLQLQAQIQQLRAQARQHQPVHAVYNPAAAVPANPANINADPHGMNLRPRMGMPVQQPPAYNYRGYNDGSPPRDR